MITELFSNRYKIISDYDLCKDINFDQLKIFTQLFSILKKDLLSSLGGIEEREAITYRFEDEEDIFCREIGRETLPLYKDVDFIRQNFHSSEARCKDYILYSDYPWRDKLSLLEILIREYEVFHKEEILFLEEKVKTPQTQGFNRVFPDPYKSKYPTSEDKIAYKKKSYDAGIDEINKRLANMGLKLSYSNGYFFQSDDNLRVQMVERPFWDLMRNNQERQSIETDMLEALDYLAKGEYDKAGQYAFLSFESALKIKFNVNEKTTFGKLVDNHLAKHRELIKFLPTQYLKDQNSYFRNESSHGPGKTKRNVPSKVETDYAISLCMSSIRLLLETKESN